MRPAPCTQVNAEPAAGLYVIVFVFLGAFFWVNLLVSVIIDHYSQMVAEQEDLIVSKEQKEWIKVRWAPAALAAFCCWRDGGLPASVHMCDVQA